MTMVYMYNVIVEENEKKTERVNVRMTEKTRHDIKLLAKLRKRNSSDVIRILVDEELERVTKNGGIESDSKKADRSERTQGS